jgi:bifunctional non-homologous end joining protein LigD
VVPSVTPQLVGNTGLRALRAAIAEPDRFVCEPKVDGVRGLVAYGPGKMLETRNRSGIRRDWLRGDAFEGGLRRLANQLPILWDGTVLDGELTAGRFETTMAALFGAKRHRAELRYVVFDVPILAGVDLRGLPWEERRERLELLAQAFDIPLELSPVVEPSRALAIEMTDGRLEGVVLKDRTSPYRDGGRSGWFKVKHQSWYEREAWRFEHR